MYLGCALGNLRSVFDYMLAAGRGMDLPQGQEKKEKKKKRKIPMSILCDVRRRCFLVKSNILRIFFTTKKSFLVFVRESKLVHELRSRVQISHTKWTAERKSVRLFIVR